PRRAIRYIPASIIPQARLQPRAAISMVRICKRSAVVTLTAPVMVRAIIRPNRISEIRSTGSRTLSGNLIELVQYQIRETAKSGECSPVCSSHRCVIGTFWPRRMGVEGFYPLRQFWGFWSKIFLKDIAGVTDNERHPAEFFFWGGVSNDPKSAN